MKALIVYCNPNPQSFTAHLRDRIITALSSKGAEVRVTDLYGEGFDPVMCREERAGYHTAGHNERPVELHLDNIRWCDTVVFVYPTWWFGTPAMLKGWLDRVMVPHATFSLPTKDEPIRGELQNVQRILAVTTCGARRWQSKFVGEPGRKTLLRAFRLLCHPRCKTRYAAFYKIDSSSQEQRERFADTVAREAARL